MATWHQQQAMRRALRAGTSIRHDDAARWTVVIDPPRGLRASILFAAECDAVRYAARVPHSYILPPRNMRES